MTDRAALRAITRGDTDALALLIDRYSAYVATVAHNIIGASMQHEDVEEVTSDVFLTLWKNASKPDSAKLKPWLGAVARNAAKMKLRKLTGDLPLEDEYINLSDEGVEMRLSTEDEARIVRHTVESLKPPDNEIFLMHYYGLKPVTQIAESTGMSVSAVKMRLSRGREKLRVALEEGGVSR